MTVEGGARRADLGIDQDGRVAAIEATLPPGDEDVDASGLYVLPGGVDSHCHIEQKTSTGLTPVDDFYTASVGALAGGTTTMIPFACQHRGQRIRDVVADYRKLAAKAATDYALHLIVSDPSEPHAVADLQQAFSDGYSSVKVYMTYDALKLRDEELLDVLALCREHAAMVMVHAESHEVRERAPSPAPLMGGLISWKRTVTLTLIISLTIFTITVTLAAYLMDHAPSAGCRVCHRQVSRRRSTLHRRA